MSFFFGIGCLKVGLSYEEGCCWVGNKIDIKSDQHTVLVAFGLF